MRASRSVRSLGAVIAAAIVGVSLSVAAAGPAWAAECATGTQTAEQLPSTVPWAQQILNAERVWSMTKGEGVTVAVIDSGVQADHEVLQGKVKSGKAYIDIAENKRASSGDDATTDCVGHGTAVAGIIAGKPTNASPFHGIAPEAKILPIRVANTDPSADWDVKDEGAREPSVVTASDVAKAIELAVDQGARVINLSLKFSEDHPVLKAAVAEAIRNDAVIVAAAGNDQEDPEKANKPSYPAAYDGVIGVGAVDQNLARVSYSQIGSWVDVVAPGVSLTAPQRDGKYQQEFGGTSGATAFVSGTAALLKSYHKDWSPAQISKQITSTASMVAGNELSPSYGHGFINPYAAVTETVRSDAEPVVIESMDRLEMDEAYVQKLADFDTMESLSSWIGIAGVTALIVTWFGVAALRRGRRTNWHIRRANPKDQLDSTDDGDPIPLYHGIKGLDQ